MTRAIRSRSRILAAAVLAGALGLALPAFAQSTGMVKGKVLDGKNQPVEGAQVKIDAKDGVSRHFTVKTNKKGEFIQVGLQPGMYDVTASKEGVGTATQQARISLGGAEEVNLTLSAGGGGSGAPMSKEEVAYRKAFDEGVAASKAGKNDEAIAKFQEALTARPDCYACQYNVGAGYAAKQDWDKAEAAFQAAAKLAPDSAEPYNALAGLYNSQKKYDKAAEMTAEATKRQGAGGTGPGGAGGASAETLYNQGVILWNAGKIAEAKTQFESAVKAKPEYADAHYRLGMAYLNEGKLPEAGTEFETYVKLAPTGQWAAEAKNYADQLKPKQ